MKSQNTGFTLYELLIVIIVIVILGVIAVPKFLRLALDTKISTLEGMKGAMASGAELIYAEAALQDKVEGAQSVDLGDVTVLVYDGYPVGNWNSSIRYLVGLDAVGFSSTSAICNVEWCGRGNQTSIPSGVSTTSPGRMGKVFPRGYAWNDECGVYYINHEDGRRPELGLETADC